MNQEQTLYKMTDISRLTGEMLLKAFLFMVEGGEDIIRNKEANKNFTGETKWNKLMNKDSSKEIKSFLTNEVNFERLKDYLKERGIAFAFRQLNDDKVELMFESKNRAVVATAFKELISDLTNPEKVDEITEKLSKTPENMPLAEKMNYQKNKVAEDIQKANAIQNIKAPTKEVLKDEVAK